MTGGETTVVALLDPSGRLESHLGDALDAAGFDAATVTAATDCLRRVERGTVDAVVSEYALPDLDGLRLLRSIRISAPAFPFLLVPDDGSEAVASDAAAVAVPDLRQAVRELLENAATCGDDAPTVEAEADADDGWGTVRVRDDGPGIPDVERETLLPDRDIDQLPHSSGLGLLYVYWVARLSGGDFDVSTADSGGTTVTVTLPLADA